MAVQLSWVHTTGGGGAVDWQVGDDGPGPAGAELPQRRGGGLDLLRRDSVRRPRLPWRVFSMHDSPALVAQALRRVAAGERHVLSVDVAGAVSAPAAAPPHQAPSLREFDVRRLLVEGRAVPDIANALHLCPKPVSDLQTRIRTRLAAASDVYLWRYAQQCRLLVP